MKSSNSHRNSFVTAAILVAFCCAPGFSQFSENLSIIATLSPTADGQPVLIEVTGESFCPTLSEPTFGLNTVRFDFTGHCPLLPPAPGPFSLFTLLPHLTGGVWQIELFELDLAEVVATTEVKILNPDFAIDVEASVVTDASSFTIITSGIASVPSAESPVVDGNTIRLSVLDCGICDPPPPVTPFEIEHEIDALPAGSYTLELYYRGTLVAVETLEIVSANSCLPNATTICLDNGRFRVTANWETQGGTSGPAFATEETDTTGLFWFFDPGNIELVVKTIDACNTLSDSFWVFAGGLTDVGVTLEVTDMQSDTTITYENPIGQRFVTITDTAAFSTCP